MEQREQSQARLDFAESRQKSTKGQLEGKTMFQHWKPLLTDMLIDSVKADDGILGHRLCHSRYSIVLL